MAIDHIEHTFGPGETVHAIIRKYNHMAMSASILNMLSVKYNVLNNDQLPHPGDRVKIPIFIGFVGSTQTEKSYTNG
jgi:hypothetical protein